MASSYTEANPPTDIYRCHTCQMTLSGDNVTQCAIDLFHIAHDQLGHKTEETHAEVAP